jgi:hypothetical protein
MKETPKKPDDGTPQRRQASAVVVRRRVEELVRILLDGAIVEWDVCEFVREREKEAGSAWEVKEGEKPLSYSQIRRYVVKADRLIAESCRASRKKLLRRHMAQRRNLFAKAVSAGDYRTALAVSRDEAELQGLYPPKTLALTGAGGKRRDELSDADRAAALQGLYARLGAGDGDATAGGEAVPDGSVLGGSGEGPVGRGPDAGPLAGGAAPPPPAPDGLIGK